MNSPSRLLEQCTFLTSCLHSLPHVLVWPVLDTIDDRSQHFCAHYVPENTDLAHTTYVFCIGGTSIDLRRGSEGADDRIPQREHAYRDREMSNRMFVLELPAFHWKEAKLDRVHSNILWYLILLPFRAPDFVVDTSSMPQKYSTAVSVLLRNTTYSMTAAKGVGLVDGSTLLIAGGICGAATPADLRDTARIGAQAALRPFTVHLSTHTLGTPCNRDFDSLGTAAPMPPAVVNLSRVDWAADTPLVVVESAPQVLRPGAAVVDRMTAMADEYKALQAMFPSHANRAQGSACTSIPSGEWTGVLQ